MEQGHARGFCFHCCCAALSGCKVVSPQPWTGKGSGPGPKDRWERGARAWGCLGQGVSAGTRRALVTACLWAQRASLQMEETLPRSARFSAQLGPEAPGKAGHQHCPAQTVPHCATAWVWGTAREQGEPLRSPGRCQQQPPLRRGTANTCSPGGEAALPRLDLPPRAPGTRGVSTAPGEGGTAQGMAEEAARPQ